MAESYYRTHRGITLGLTGGKHSFRDFSLVPAGAAVLEEAEPEESYLEIPGVHGSLDLTESLFGYPVYRDREGSFPFYLRGPKNRRLTVRTELVRRYHGRRVEIIEDREPDVYLSGRLTVEDPDKDGSSGITISGRFSPFKMDITASDEDWLWDPFSFEYGVIREYGAIEVDGSYTLHLISSPFGGSPQVKASTSGMTVTAGGVTYALTTDYSVLADLRLPADYSQEDLVFTGTGTVSVKYRGGRL
jgi:hypothetical protein